MSRFRPACLLSCLTLFVACAVPGERHEAVAPVAAGEFAARFTGKTLRFDYDHVGTAAEEHIAVHRWRVEGDWAGSRTHLVDDTGFGKYLVEVRDPATDELLYSRGFCSIYGEWETTGEAQEAWRSFQESHRRLHCQVERVRGSEGARPRTDSPQAVRRRASANTRQPSSH
jgi:hypothetical protein